MNKLVATLLQYNRLANATKIEKTPCQIENIIQSEIEKYSSLLQCNNIELLVNVKPYKKVNMNENLISLVVDNFLSNAIKHTNGKITIAGTEEKGGYKVSVANEGENIKKEYEKNLWDVFYRTDEARTKNDNNSTGMGLAICKQILQLHKFKFGFNNLQNGVEFYFIIK
jgi:signal transduction histidine kinase